MRESRRLQVLHELIDTLNEGNNSSVVKDLTSIYQDIYAIDNAVSSEVESEIVAILHHAYAVNGGFEWEKTGPNTYSVFFYGRCRNNDGTRKCIRVDLKIGNCFAMILDYEIL